MATLLLVAAILSRATGCATDRPGDARGRGEGISLDTANLRDLYRVLSLFARRQLMLLAFLYQRFVFGERPEARGSRSEPAAR